MRKRRTEKLMKVKKNPIFIPEQAGVGYLNRFRVN